ncbi:MAG: tetratricopeptide repeat protein [Bacteroidota bacterium]
MLKKSLLSLLFLLAICAVTFAQNDLKARLDYDEAVKAFDAKNYELTLQHVAKVEELMGWNPKTGFVKIQAMDKLADYTSLSNPITEKLNEAVVRYLEYTSKQNPDDVVMDKFKAVYEINQKLKTVRDEMISITEYGKKYAQFKKNIDTYAAMPEYIEANKAAEAKDYKKAVELYKSIDKKQNPLAYTSIARIAQYQDSYGININEAMLYYHKAIEMGNLSQIETLAGLYRMEKNNKVEYFKWLKIGAENGLENCYWSLALFYENKDYQKALFWHTKYAELNNTMAMTKIGDFYKEGKGVTKSATEAFKWYLKAASFTEKYADGSGVRYGDEEAMVNVGLAYLYGTGVAKDGTEGFRWILKAAELGYDEGLYRDVANHYKNGDVVAKNLPEAFKWFAKSAENGDAKSMEQLAIMYKIGSGVQKDKKLAAEWQAKYEAAKN